MDSTFYSTVSMLRAIELFAGIQPHTQFDAAAIPMLNAFRGKPDQQAYTAVVPAQSLTETNGASAPMAAQSARMNFSDADLADEQQLNEAIWQSVKGPNTPMPQANHSTPRPEHDK